MTSSTAPLSKPAAATTARRVFARITTLGITQRSSLTRTETTSKRSSTGTASCQPPDARLGEPQKCGHCSHFPYRSKTPCERSEVVVARLDDADMGFGHFVPGAHEIAERLGDDHSGLVGQAREALLSG